MSREDERAGQVKRRNAVVWDGHARGYDAQGWGRWTSTLFDIVLGAIDWSSVETALDVGCGTGELLRSLLARKAVKAAGIDLSPEMVRIARGKLAGEVDLRTGDAEGLPWPGGSFDAVFCTASFHHYPRPGRALSEMCRVLVPGGRLVLADAWIPSPMRQIANIFLPHLGQGDVRMYSESEVRAMLKEAGFARVEWQRVGWNAYVAAAHKPGREAPLLEVGQL